MRPRTLSIGGAIGLALALLVGTSAGSAGAGALLRAHTASAFPVTIETGAGAAHLAARPTRILCLSASATQMLYAIGAGSEVIGVDQYSTYPASAPRTSFTGYETSAEDYVKKSPDLIILAFSEGTMIAQLKKLNIPTLLLPSASDVDAAESQIETLGAATGHEAGATQEIGAINADLTSVVASAKGHGRGATYYIEYDQTYYSATSDTFAGSLFSRFKMLNIADKAKGSSAYPQLSAEYVLAANPDYVFLGDTVCCGQSASTFAKRPGFSVLRAVQEHHVIGVNDSVASEWGPHSLETFVSVIAKALDG